MSSGDESEELKRAIEMSMAPDSPNLSKVASRPGTAQSKSRQPKVDEPKISSQTEGLPSDLKTLRKERHARHESMKRKAPPDGFAQTDSEVSSNKKAKPNVIDLESSNVNVGKQLSSQNPTTSKLIQNSTTSFAPGSFPKGVIKRTWAFGCDRDADIMIEEVLQKDRIERGLLSSFMWDTEWILGKLQPNAKMVLTMNSKNEEDKKKWTHDAKQNYPNLRLCFPSLPGQANCMHSKLMLLFHGTHMRIVIPTANLTKHDWGETGLTENLVFLIDLPHLVEGQTKIQTAFEVELLHYLKSMDVQEGICRSIPLFDFAETSRLAFIHTIAGSHFDEAADRTGFLGLAKSVRQLGLQSSAKLHLDYATASLGALNYRLLTDLYKSAMGSDPAAEPVMGWAKHLESKFRVFFPTHETVMKSKGKADAAGTICLHPKYWNGAGFPGECMREHESTRPGLLSHNKLLLARGEHEDDKIAWAYVGSANLSESAWGKLVKDRVKKASKLNCRNWECGVLFPVPDEDIRQLKVEEVEAPVPIQAFEKQIKLPFKFPGDKFGAKEPWFFTKHLP